ncbi:hypothetical protein B0H14DRAFT_3724848 [Mycena olivaceomarginata]|nr:hypothetical protein B0H14DRAFT_3724848 [Mycena olivaceomarginata]
MAATPVPLSYSIAASTPHSGPYRVENILVENPTEQASRWSGGPVPETGTPQWLLLRLDTLSVVHTITFGKFVNPHPCNMKNFKVYGGLSEDALTEVLHSELKNDTTSHGNSFHVSIWHVALKGIKDEVFVEQVRMKYDQYRETTAMRYVLKHLRQRRFLGPYNAILARCGLQVEDPLVTELHESVVLQGNWASAEQIVQHISQTDLFDEYRHSKQARSLWRRLSGKDANGDVPSPRGGHAMCVDPVGGMIYLFGGWDGKKSLADFWEYDIKQDKWHVLSYDTAKDDNAPGARSCHKMKFDSAPPPGEAPPPAPAAKTGPEFYRYQTRGSSSGKWELLSADPQAPHAPPLVYDHQMVMDCEAQILYVHGGRVIDGDWSNAKYAGLYSYNVRLGKWQLLQISPPKPTASFSGGIIPARFAHSMVLDDRTRTLYIFGGKTTDSGTLSDMYAYHIATNTTRQVFADMTRDCGIDMQASFQRAVIDSTLQEIYVFSGLAHEVSTLEPQEAATRIFRYHPPPGRWDVVLPAPYAHLAEDTSAATMFMHGGNGGLREKGVGGGDAMDEDEERDQRLNDFWQMTLARTLARMWSDERRADSEAAVPGDVRRRLACQSPHFPADFGVPRGGPGRPRRTESYRGLLSYLFTPSSPVMSSHPHLKTPSSASDHEDSPPRKRSRPNTPEDSEMTTPTDVEAPASPPAPGEANSRR